MVDNFSCSDYSLSRVAITEEEWMVQLRGPGHDESITALAMCQLIISVIGSVWNTIVLAVILLKKKFKDPTYVLLMNLVVVDLLVCMFVLPFNIKSAITREFSIGHSDYTRCILCQAIGIILMALIFVSSFTLSFLSLDRLVYIKWPFKYKHHVKPKRALILNVLIWIISITVTMPPVFGFGEIEFLSTLSLCSPLTEGHSRFSDNIYYFVFLILVGLLPFLMGLVANTWILILACKFINRNRQCQYGNGINGEANHDTARNNECQDKKIHLAQVFGALFLVDIVPWLPILVTPLVQAVLRNKDVPIVLYVVLYLSVVSLSAIHPALETCLVGKARDVIYKSLCCCFMQRKKAKEKAFQPNTPPPAPKIATSAV